jgi:hypothetical protein
MNHCLARQNSQLLDQGRLFMAPLKVLWSEGVKSPNEDNRIHGGREMEDPLWGLDPFLPAVPIRDGRDVERRSRKIVGNH